MAFRQLSAPGGAFQKFLAAVLVALGLGVALFFGVLLLAVALAAALALLLASYLRLWWLRRRTGRAAPGSDSPHAGGMTIEGEYIVKKRERH